MNESMHTCKGGSWPGSSFLTLSLLLYCDCFMLLLMHVCLVSSGKSQSGTLFLASSPYFSIGSFQLDSCICSICVLHKVTC